MIHRFIPRLLPILAALALSAGEAAAQLEFAGIPWGTPPRETADRLEALGYRLRGVDQEGDWVFRGPHSAELVAAMDSARLVGVQVTWPREAGRLDVRFAALVDSFTAALGAPDDHDDGHARWERGGNSASAWLRGWSGGLDSTLFLSHLTPGFWAHGERIGTAIHARRAHEREHGPADSTGVGAWSELWRQIQHAAFVDSARFVVLGEHQYGARMFQQWQHLRRLENGMMYDAAVTEVELDCREGTMRLLRTIPLYYRDPLPAIEVPFDERQWDRPEPGGLDAFLIENACAVLTRQAR